MPVEFAYGRERGCSKHSTLKGHIQNFTCTETEYRSNHLREAQSRPICDSGEPPREVAIKGTKSCHLPQNG